MASVAQGVNLRKPIPGSDVHVSQRQFVEGYNRALDDLFVKIRALMESCSSDDETEYIAYSDVLRYVQPQGYSAPSKRLTIAPRAVSVQRAVEDEPVQNRYMCGRVARDGESACMYCQDCKDRTGNIVGGA